MVHQGDERRDRSHRKLRLMFPHRFERRGGIESKRQDERLRDQLRERDMGDEPGDVKERRQAVHRTVDPRPVAVHLRRKSDVTVRIHAALRHAGRSGRIHDHRNVVAFEADGFGFLTAMLSYQRTEFEHTFERTDGIFG